MSKSKRLCGKTQHLSINDTWVYLFARNHEMQQSGERPLSDSEILDFMNAEFPEKGGAAFSVNGARSAFNKGRLPGGQPNFVSESAGRFPSSKPSASSAQSAEARRARSMGLIAGDFSQHYFAYAVEVVLPNASAPSFHAWKLVELNATDARKALEATIKKNFPDAVSFKVHTCGCCTIDEDEGAALYAVALAKVEKLAAACKPAEPKPTSAPPKLTAKRKPAPPAPASTKPGLKAKVRRG